MIGDKSEEKNESTPKIQSMRTFQSDMEKNLTSKTDVERHKDVVRKKEEERQKLKVLQKAQKSLETGISRDNVLAQNEPSKKIVSMQDALKGVGVEADLEKKGAESSEKEVKKEELSPYQKHLMSDNTARNVEKEKRFQSQKIDEKIRGWHATQTTPQKSKGALFLLIIIIMLLVGIASVSFAFYLTLKEDEPTTVIGSTGPQQPVYIPSDVQSFVEVTNGYENLIQRFRSAQKIGVLTEIIPYKEINGVKKQIRAQEFLDKNTNANSSLQRVIDDFFFVGILQTNKRKEILLVLPINNYNEAFGAMLNWEENLVHNLEFLIGFDDPTPLPIGTTFSRYGFEDVLLQNSDVRAIIDVEGNYRALYSFINKGTLIITTSRELFSGAVSQLKNQPARR